MKSRSTTTLVLGLTMLFSIAWSVRPVADARIDPPPRDVRVTVVSVDGTTSDVRERVSHRHLLGRYGRGDSLGYNLCLSLKDGGRFDCTWAGCVGLYGTCSGTWAIQESGLTLTSQRACGMFEHSPLDNLRILSVRDHYLLMQLRDEDWFAKHGADTYACFHRQEARKALEDHMRNQWNHRGRQTNGNRRRRSEVRLERR